MSKSYQLRIIYNSSDFAISDLTNKLWEKADAVIVKKYWSGKTASAGRQFTARLLWSDTALYVRFEAKRSDPLVISDLPDLSKKTLGLWDRDVCEIFLAPDKNEPRKYFEFEVAPSGEWVDVELDVTTGERKSDWDYGSGMESAVKVEKDKIVMAIKIGWKAFGDKPKTGDIWLGNLFRCVGKDPDRGYLAWSPTMTKNPNFHVPEKFGQFIFQT
ncbi:MAG: carbohydrate-binding family 9-like protein [Pyrinomonadaceae bacterium]